MKPSQTAARNVQAEKGRTLLAEVKATAAKGSEDNLSGVLVYGDWGTGKTNVLTEAVLRKKNVFVVTTELGRNGLRTVSESLKKAGKLDLFDKHVRSWEPESGEAGYNQFLAHLDSDYFERQFGDWTPDIDVWEGISTFQINDVDEYILRKESKEMKDSELRDEALVSSRQDWAAIKRGTLRALGRWANKRWNGRKVHKFATMDEETKEEESFGVITRKIRPYLQGAAAKLVAKPFDLIMRVTVEKGDKGTPRYMYTTADPSGKVSVKRRNIGLPDHFEADPKRVWDALLGVEE